MKEKNIAKDANSKGFGKHGWIFIIYGMLTFFITTAVSDSINNLSLPAFCEQYGWDYANLLSLRSVYGWFTIIFMAVLENCCTKDLPFYLSAYYNIGAVYGDFLPDRGNLNGMASTV